MLPSGRGFILARHSPWDNNRRRRDMTEVLLDRNENRYGPAPACLDVLRRLPSALLYEYPREFKRGRYSLLSKRLAESHGVEEDHVLLGYGCEDLFKQAICHYLGRDDRFFAPEPSWWYYRALAEEVGGVPVACPLIEAPFAGEATAGFTHWRYAYDVDALIDRHRHAPARVLVISSPNNPTGSVFPLDRLRETLDAFRNAIVVLDEAYWGYVDLNGFDGPALTKEFSNLLVLRTFSKLYGLAGARVGYAVVGAGLRSFAQLSARYLGYCRLTEQLALAALDEVAYYDDLRRKVAEDRGRLYETLRGYDGIRVYDSAANFVLVRFPHALCKPLHAGLAARGLIVRFFDEEPELAGCARMTLGTQAETEWLCESLDALLPELLKLCA
jgi:histidinol-phosphate aminotransferase